MAATVPNVLETFCLVAVLQSPHRIEPPYSILLFVVVHDYAYLRDLDVLLHIGVVMYPKVFSFFHWFMHCEDKGLEWKA
jgi:hypothetical protein